MRIRGSCHLSAIGNIAAAIDLDLGNVTAKHHIVGKGLVTAQMTPMGKWVGSLREAPKG